MTITVSPYAATSENPEFLIVSIFAGDNNLSKFVDKDIREMATGNKGNIVVLALTDYKDKPSQVIEITSKGEVRVIETPGEIDTGDSDLLANFTARSLITFPSARKIIGFWGHGTGAIYEKEKIWNMFTRNTSSPTHHMFFTQEEISANPDIRAMLHDETSGGVLTSLEAAAMLRKAFQLADIDGKIDLIYSDCCLNGMVEILQEIGEFSHCVVGSADREPGDGWKYDDWFARIGNNAVDTPTKLAYEAVASYGDHYKNNETHKPRTLGAFRTDNEIIQTFRLLHEAAKKEGRQGYRALDKARHHSQKYDRRDTFDLIDFCDQLIREFKTGEGIKKAAHELRDATQKARIHSIAYGDNITASHGIAFWFPKSRRRFRREVLTYHKLKFDRETAWSSYLRKHV